MIGKLALQENTFHNIIFRKAIEVNTKTIEHWKQLLYEVNVTEFDHIKEHCDNDYRKWQAIVKNSINNEILRQAK